MPYTPTEIAILKKYKIMEPDGTMRQIELHTPHVGVNPPGPGPLISPDALNRLLRADTTPNKRWLDWIFHQAGGGEVSVNQTTEVIRQIKDRFIDERTNGFPHPRTGVYQPAIPRPQAEARWLAAEPRFREVLSVCDQDAVKRLRTFGYFRDWPGNANVYAKVVDAITQFLRHYKKVVRMNQEIAREGGEPVPMTPEDIPTYQVMEEITKKVGRYFASKKARSDIRSETIYDDDVITALAPFTYAAAVEHGYDLWPFSSRKGFEAVLGAEPGAGGGYGAARDEWKATTAHSVIVFLTFKAPTPCWVARRDGTWELKNLEDLALTMNKDMSRRNTDDWTVIDQENRNTQTIAQIKQMILAEPTRVDPAEQETPIIRGGNVYKNEAEAQRVVDALERAVSTVKEWYPRFMKAAAKLATAGKPAKIKSDVFTLD